MPSKSPASPLRPIIVRAASAAERAGLLAASRVSGVITKPGEIALQHTPRGAHASDWDRVSDARPPLDAPYPPLFPNARTACWDATLMIRPQPRPETLTEQERGGQVDRHGLVPVGDREGAHRRAQVDARAVDEDVGLPEPFGRMLGAVRQRATVAQVRADPRRGAARGRDRGGCGGERVRVPCEQDHPGPCVGQRPRDRPADAGAAAGDDGDPSVEREQIPEVVSHDEILPRSGTRDCWPIGW